MTFKNPDQIVFISEDTTLFKGIDRMPELCPECKEPLNKHGDCTECGFSLSFVDDYPNNEDN